MLNGFLHRDILPVSNSGTVCVADDKSYRAIIFLKEQFKQYLNISFIDK